MPLHKYLLPVFLVLTNLVTVALAQGTRHVKNETISVLPLPAKEKRVVLKVVKNLVQNSETHYEFPANDIDTITFDLEKTELGNGYIAYGDSQYPIFLPARQPVSFSFVRRDFANTLKFYGAISLENNYLVAYKRAFEAYGEKYYEQAVADSSPETFKALINRHYHDRIDFYKEQTAASDFDVKLKEIIRADIDYWRAYWLLEYAIQYSYKAENDYLKDISQDYFDFLKEVELSDDEVLLSLQYRKFLDVIRKILKEERYMAKYIFGEKVNLMTLRKTVFFEDGQKGVPMAYHLEGNAKLVGLDLRFYKSHGFSDIAADDWVKVMTADKKVGTVKFSDLILLSNKPAEKTEEPETKGAIPTKQVQVFAIPVFDDIQIQKEPYESEIIGHARGHEKLLYLNNHTTTKNSYTKNGVTYTDYFYHVQMKNGQVGWVARREIELVQETSEIIPDLVESKKAALSPEVVTLKKYFKGETLYYVLARKIYEDLIYFPIEQMKPQVISYIQSCPYIDFDVLVQNMYSEALAASGKGEEWELDEDILVADANKIEGFGLAHPVKENAVFYGEEHDPQPSTVLAPVYEVAEEPAVTGAVEISNVLSEHNTVDTKVEAGRVSNVYEKLSLTLISEPINFTEHVMDLSKPYANRFAGNVSLATPVMGELTYGDKRVDVYLAPGEDLKISFNGRNFFNTLTYAGSGAPQNQYLADKKAYFTVMEANLHTKIEYASAAEFSAFLASAYQKMLDWHEAYDKNGFSEEFRRYAKAEIDYWYAYNMLNYPIEHPLYKDEPSPMAVDAGYYDFLERFPASVDGILHSKYYIYFLQLFMDYQKALAENAGLSDFDLVDNYLTGEAAYYYKTKLLSMYCKRGQAVEYGQTIKDFIATCPYDVFNDVLKTVYNEKIGLHAGQQAPDFVLTDIHGNQIKLSDYRGKVVYLDFWATYCAPCLRNMPYSEEVRAKYAGQDVEFLYISLDKTKEGWKRFVKKKGYTGIHLFGKSDDVKQENIEKVFEVKGLPTYILIDKQGKIAYMPALNPYDNSGLESQINSLLY